MQPIQNISTQAIAIGSRMYLQTQVLLALVERHHVAEYAY